MELGRWVISSVKIYNGSWPSPSPLQTNWDHDLFSYNTFCQWSKKESIMLSVCSCHQTAAFSAETCTFPPSSLKFFIEILETLHCFLANFLSSLCFISIFRSLPASSSSHWYPGSQTVRNLFMERFPYGNWQINSYATAGPQLELHRCDVALMKKVLLCCFIYYLLDLYPFL